MEDFLVRIRLEALKNTLLQVQRVFESVRARRKDIEDLGQNVEQAGDQLNALTRELADMSQYARPPFGLPRVDESLLHHFELMKGYGNSLSQALNSATGNIDVVRKRWAPIEKVEEMARDSIGGAIDRWTRTIDDNLKALSDSTGNINHALEAAWSAHQKIIEEQDELFALPDYVQFLGGLALRDTGLDQGICRLADELISGWSQIGWTKWDALTIPAHKEAVTLARSIRMGFPEWSLWSVPLTAHELGQVAITGGRRKLKRSDDSTEWERYILRSPKKQQYSMTTYLADAFATLAMGPAYACAAILLKFDPAAAYDEGKRDSPSHAKRAYIILDMLSKMLAEDEVGAKPYAETVTQLTNAWNAALARSQPSESISANDKRILEELSSYMFDNLSKRSPGGLYAGEYLESTREALKLLMRSKDPGPALTDKEEGRDVLNAAWELRLEGEYDFHKIERNSQSLWDLIIERRRRLEAQTAKPQSSPIPKVDLIPGKTSWRKVS